MTDWELWACANQMLVQHGDDAAVQAAFRADALLEADDRSGHAVWCAIVSRIEQLSNGDSRAGTRH